jgi:hypothetical protein
LATPPARMMAMSFLVEDSAVGIRTATLAGVWQPANHRKRIRGLRQIAAW